MWSQENKSKFKYLGLGLIILFTLFTRFYNLGYSDYIGDEHKAFMQRAPGESTYEFLMNQRKGPMQYFVTSVTYFFVNDYRNELAFRVPFAFINLVGVIALYFLIMRISKSHFISFVGTFLFAFNGFNVGFSRIAQYQNINILFSILALYFYYSLLTENSSKKRLVQTLLGTLTLSISILAHWDAIFVVPPIIFVFTKYLLNKDVVKNEKVKLIIGNFILGSFLLLPFLIPYINYQQNSPENMEYFQRRVEIGYFNSERYKLLIELYNPFLTFYLLITLGLIGVINKKTLIFTLWFVFAFLSFEIFVRKPGTHIYNFILPACILSAYGAAKIKDLLPSKIKFVWCFILFTALGFILFQTYYIFIDHTKEYPWEQKVFYDWRDLQEWNYDRNTVKTRDRIYTKWETPKYNIDQKLPLFGFPHKRYWNEINSFVNTQNYENNEELGYMTNEVKTISEWYMDTKYKSSGLFYIVGIKRPLSFVDDWGMTQYGSRTLVHEIQNDFGETVVRIYKTRGRD